jgi:hypothetical protein
MVDRDERQLDPKQQHFRLQAERVLLTVVVAAVGVVASWFFTDFDFPGWLFWSTYAVLVAGMVALPILLILLLHGQGSTRQRK